MSSVFIDAAYFIAALEPRDEFHARASELSELLAAASFVTSEPVLIEVLNYMSKRGESGLMAAERLVRGLPSNARMTVIPQRRELFRAGLDLYAARRDKSYGMTDCMSMVICREHSIVDVLTHDHHFEQEGFTILM